MSDTECYLSISYFNYCSEEGSVLFPMTSFIIESSQNQQGKTANQKKGIVLIWSHSDLLLAMVLGVGKQFISKCHKSLLCVVNSFSLRHVN